MHSKLIKCLKFSHFIILSFLIILRILNINFLLNFLHFFEYFEKIIFLDAVIVFVAFLIFNLFLRYFNVLAIYASPFTIIEAVVSYGSFYLLKLPSNRPTEVSMRLTKTFNAEKIWNWVQQKRWFILYDYGGMRLIRENHQRKND